MATVEQWDKTIASLGKWYSQEKANNKALQAKIDALDRAKGILREALSKAGTLDNHIRKIQVDDRWKGTLSNRVRNAKKAGSSTSFMICKEIEQGIKDLEAHTRTLRAQQNDLVKLLSSIEVKLEHARGERARESANRTQS